VGASELSSDFVSFPASLTSLQRYEAGGVVHASSGLERALALASLESELDETSLLFLAGLWSSLGLDEGEGYYMAEELMYQVYLLSLGNP
jgi:hypothetical protein